MNAVLLALPLLITTSTPRTPILVELFTSEGCLSCMPDELVMQWLDRKQPLKDVEVIALSFHVDYWDYLGGKDPYALPEASEHQQRYANNRDDHRLYTPMMVVDGSSAFVGNHPQIEAEATAAAKRTRVPLRLTPKVEGDVVVVRVQMDKALAEGLELWAALAEDGIVSHVTSGDNEGATLPHTGVVRVFAKLPAPKATEGGFLSEARLKMAPGWKRDKLRAVAVLQAPGGPVKGVAAVGLASK